MVHHESEPAAPTDHSSEGPGTLTVCDREEIQANYNKQQVG